MREWIDIVAAYRSLGDAGKPSALATVVRVEGSAYRRPGARMLIAEDGRTWGGVSGGCLERDVTERARGVIANGRAFLQRYDTTDEELIERGVSTGCGGTIDVLIQPLSLHHSTPIDVIHATLTDRRARVLATIVRADRGWHELAGTAFDATAWVAGEPCDSTTSETVTASIPVVLRRAYASLLKAASNITIAGPVGSTASIVVTDADRSAEIFLDRLAPPQRLVIVGGGPDAVPVVAIAKTLGWRVAVVAARPALSLEARFAAADERYVTPADAPLAGVPLGPADAVVVMTHNLARDAAAMAALTVRPRYLGLLGPRHRTARVTAALPDTHPGREPVSPVGLDIGSETPEEIALSIVAEIQSCVRRTGTAAEQGVACRA